MLKFMRKTYKNFQLKINREYKEKIWVLLIKNIRYNF